MQYNRFVAFLAAFCLAATLLAQTQTTTLAGVAYDPTASLQTKLTQRKDAEGKPLSLYNLTFSGGSGASVPALISVPVVAAAGKRPAVILLHGLGGDKNQLQALAMLLSGKGYLTVAIDVAGHGDRPKVNDKSIAEQDLAGMRTVAAQTVQDLRCTVDYLASRPDVDVKRIGFVGVSLGGVLGARFLTEEPRVAAAALWVAGGDWGTLITTSAHPFAKRFRDSGENDAMKIRAALADVDPVPTLSRAAPRPLLFLTGASDDVVPRACSDALFAAAKEPKERVILPGGHVPNLFDMASRTITFLEKNLKKSVRSGT
ncbi:alpha/beta hydrolase family protein [Armatimonas sp.]|uniref:alpha/beta hydrolase family protein n=1 Tax=Armatimonas sp. TaxID=1872638 RepID=UPI0037506945